MADVFSSPSGPGVAALRRTVLAAAVLHDLDVEIDADGAGSGLTITGTRPISVSWRRIREAVDDAFGDEERAVQRVVRWIRLRLIFDRVPLPLLTEAACVIGLPTGHAAHPGTGWIREAIPGGALSLGLGLSHLQLEGLDVHLPDAEDGVSPLPPGLLEDVGLDPELWWTDARTRLEELGRLACDRRRRRPKDALRPLGSADVVTLLGSRAFRRALSAEEPDGLAALVVPMRRRGWSATSMIDPAFGPAAAAATEPAQRGFDRPVLVTADEVALVAPGGQPLRYTEAATGAP